MAHTTQLSTQDLSKYFSNINEVSRLDTFADLVVTGVFPNIKEFCEASGMFKAYHNYVHRPTQKYPPYAKSIYVVGDGQSPRCGVMFAFRTKDINIYSIDPEMKDKYLNWTTDDGVPVSEWLGTPVFDYEIKCRVRRLRCYKQKIEDFGAEFGSQVLCPIIVGCHCHVNLEKMLKCHLLNGVAETYAILMPCCISLINNDQKKHIIAEYHDQGIPSAHNKVYVLRWE